MFEIFIIKCWKKYGISFLSPQSYCIPRLYFIFLDSTCFLIDYWIYLLFYSLSVFFPEYKTHKGRNFCFVYPKFRIMPNTYKKTVNICWINEPVKLHQLFNVHKLFWFEIGISLKKKIKFHKSKNIKTNALCFVLRILRINS